MIGWIARDKDNGSLVLFDDVPYRDGDIWQADSHVVYCELDQDFFDYPIEWEDEPVKVEIGLWEVSDV